MFFLGLFLVLVVAHQMMEIGENAGIAIAVGQGGEDGKRNCEAGNENVDESDDEIIDPFTLVVRFQRLGDESFTKKKKKNRVQLRGNKNGKTKKA